MNTPLTCVSSTFVVVCNRPGEHTDPNDPSCTAPEKGGIFLIVSCSDGSSAEVQLNKGIRTAVGCPDDDGPVGIIHEQLDPTKELNKLFTQAKFRNALANLKGAVNKNNEEGYEIRLQNDLINTNFVQGSFKNTPLAYGGNIIAGMHTHTENGNPMFSGYDINTLLRYYEAYSRDDKNPSLMFSIIVTPTGVYAMTIKNVTMLRYLVNTIGVEKINDRLNFEYYNEFNGVNSIAYLDDITNVLNNLYAEYGMPDKALNIYRLNTEGNTFVEHNN